MTRKEEGVDVDSEKGALNEKEMQKLCKLCSVLYYFITFASAPHRINKELHRWVINNAYKDQRFTTASERPIGKR